MDKEIVNKPYTIREAVNKATGNKATAYYNKGGLYIVRDDVTGDLVQMNDRLAPQWIPDSEIINPYVP